MTGPMDPACKVADTVTLDEAPSQAWVASVAAVNRYSDPVTLALGRIVGAIQMNAAFATLHDDGPSPSASAWSSAG